MRYLGIDYGTRKIGLALSDEAGTMGFPHRIISADERIVETLAALIEKEGVGAVVIGESLDFSGSENAVAKEARALGDALTARGIQVAYEPEVLTTQEARRDPEGVHGTKGAVDASAAALILTSYLSRTDE